MKKLAIIGGGVMASYFGEACHRIGYEGHDCSMLDGKVELGKVDFFHEINIFDIDKIVEICKELKVDGVVATTELTVPITAHVANRLGLLGNPIEVANQLTDKYRNRECIKELTDLLSPQYAEVKSVEGILESGISFPMILKPTNLGGKRGVAVVHDESTLQKAFEYTVRSYGEKEVQIIAEQFLSEGIECSVESLSYQGHHTIIQITKKDSSGPPHCVELGHHQPASISKEQWDNIVKAVSSGLTAIGLTHGPCHTEIKLIDNKVYLIEFNARPGGDHIWWPMIELSTGFDIMAAIAMTATGELKSIDVNGFKHRYSGLYYVVKQTADLKPIFDNCENESWCWERHFITDELMELVQNDMEHTNYIIYSSDESDPIETLKEKQDHK